MARAPGCTLWLMRGEFVLAGHDSSTVDVKLVGANRRARVEGLGRLPGIHNYFVGKDPAKWRSGVPLYRKVAVREVYPGIDLLFYGNPGQLEYDWVVAPGADPKRIRLKLEGASDLRSEPRGDLVMNGVFRQKRPLAYQMIEGRRHEIDSSYIVRGRDVTIRLAAYDAHLPLVIDPALVYSSFFGGNGQSNIAESVAVDAAGNAFVTGFTNSTNFPVLKPLQGGITPGESLPFVSKISPDGTLLYSTFLGGLGDQAHGIAVDRAGNAYVTGISAPGNLPAVNALQAQGAGGNDAFVAKISPDGSKLVYSTYLGGSGLDFGTAIAVDPAGNACITGYTTSADFPTANALQPKLAGRQNAFAARITADGSALIYSTYLGGSGSDSGMDVATDPQGAAYITGYTNSADFPTVNALQGKYGGNLWSGFVTKLAADGSAVYSTFLGGKGANTLIGDRGFCIAADAAGNAYVEGYTTSPNFPVQPNGPAGSSDMRTFVSKIDPAGSTVQYTAYIPSTLVGAMSQERNCGIAVDLAGNAYATGAATSASFLTTSDALQSTFGGGVPGFGGNDSFLTKLSADGSTTLYSTYLGGNHQDYATGIAVRGSDAYVTGFTSSPDFPTTDPSQPRSPFGDVFVTRIAGDGPAPSNIVNSASGLAGPIAPGEWITIEGAQLGPPEGASYSLNPDGGVDPILAGVQVLFDTTPGTPTYVSGGQINVIVPYEIADRASTNVSVIYQQAVSLPITLTVRDVSPAIYTANGTGQGQARVTNEDGTMNGPPGTDTEPAPQGSIISVYGTGGGQTDPPSVTGSVTAAGALLPLANWTPDSGTVAASIGGKPASVIFAGASPGDLTGVLRLDIRVPSGVSGDALPIAVTIDGISTPPGPTVSVR